jgi:AraC-like DNA-binding protein
LGYAVHIPGVGAIDQICDGAIAIGFNILNELANVTPTDIHLAHKAPDDIMPYRRFFGMTPRFDAEQYGLVFPAELLATAVIGADPHARALLLKSVTDYWAVKYPRIAEQVARIIRSRIVFGNVSLEMVAEAMSMHPRKLNRMLRRDGVTFRNLLNEARFELGCQWLAGTRRQITDIALSLGYADASGFSHAFTRWSGKTPSRWRSEA